MGHDLLSQLIEESQAKFSDAFQTAAGPSGFSILPADTQVAVAQTVSERAAITRNIFPTGTLGLNEFIKQQSLDITNLFKLGSASVDASAALRQSNIQVSDALNERDAIREQQRAEDLISLSKTNDFITQVQGQLNEFKEGLTTPGAGGSFDPIKFFTDNPLIGGIGIGGLAVGAVVLLLVLK